ncbi:hypothetical protein CALVIDRAFT_534262 [Calocera viscosa TUFC12733]|uniref:Uncharacterized protein n=1 Tax=Calocera viscosa (strain TUFC12733) TaxID=1330018 RepID=A0A167PZJ1_CALVF|nr:hypothetical protein CALVIDRAFT_534262 [Calocera viscosa TUFC12733]
MPAGSSSSRTYLPPPDSLADLARPARGYNRDRDDWRRRGDDMYVPGEGRENQGGSGWMPRREEFDRREREREREREQERRRDEDRVRERDRRRDDDRFRGRDYRGEHLHASYMRY